MGNELQNYLNGVAEDYTTLAEHDAIYHKGGYKEGDRCQVRESLAKSDDPDKVSAKAGVMEDRVKAREDAKGVLEDFLGGHVRFTGDDNDPEGGSREVGFVVESGRPNQLGREGLSWMEKQMYNRGFVADIWEGRHHWDQPGTQFNGTIRPMTASEKLTRTMREKPKWNRDGSWMVDGEEYEDEDQAMLAWKAAMKKYGAQVKDAVGQKKEVSAPTVGA